jgi:creatinine amidohydrolase
MAIMSALPPRTRQWSDLTTTDFASLDLNRTIAVLPLGATEQHGPHLPLSVDANLAHSMVQAATPHLPPDLPVLFLPVQRVGYSPEHAAFAGTLSLKAETVIHLWTDIAERAGQRRAQAGAVQHPRRQHGPDGRGGARLAQPPGHAGVQHQLVQPAPAGGRRQDAMERFPAAEQRFGVHGGQVETSMMLALKPRLVRQSRFKSFASTSEQRARATPRWAMAAAPSWPGPRRTSTPRAPPAAPPPPTWRTAWP